MNAQQAAALALSTGAELSIDGRTINAGRERFSLVKPKPADEVKPVDVPTASPGMHQDIVAAIEKLAAVLAPRETPPAALVPPTQQTPSHRLPGASLADFASMPTLGLLDEYGFSVSRDEDGRVIEVTAPGMPGFDFKISREGGQLSAVVARYGVPAYIANMGRDQVSITPIIN